MNVTSSRVVVPALAVLVVLSGVGVVAAHGDFGVRLLVQEQAGQGVPETFAFNVTTTAADEVPAEYRSQEFDVTYTVFVDDRPIDSGEFGLGYRDHRVVETTHTFEETGWREVAVNATYSLGDGEWTERRRSTRLIEVAGQGTEAALSECNAHAGGDLLPPYRVQCYLIHRGIGGLVPGILASPVVAVALLVLLGGAALAGGRLLGFEGPW